MATELDLGLGQAAGKLSMAIQHGRKPGHGSGDRWIPESIDRELSTQ
jgi:hypothetical protein